MAASQAADVGSIPIARSISPVDAVGFTGFPPLKLTLKCSVLDAVGRELRRHKSTWTRVMRENMQPAEADGVQIVQSWSAEEESLITTIQQTESVPRIEAIRRMQRRKKAASSLPLWLARPTGARLCENPRCRRGDAGGPASLAHLRAGALYCNDACRMAAQRSPKRQNRISDRQCLRGSKANTFGSMRSPHEADEHAL